MYLLNFSSVDAVVSDKISSEMGRVFGIIILHESMRARELVLDEWDKCLVEYLCKQESVLYTFEDTDSSTALS